MAYKNVLKEEILSDEELDKVAGGTAYEMVKDSEFLHALGLLDRTYSLDDVEQSESEVAEAINSGFAKAGMNVDANYRYVNVYSFNGSEEGMGRFEAYKAIVDKVKPGFDYKQFF